MNLNDWISQARDHWRRFQPIKFKELLAAGKLNMALREAAELTHREMTELENSGFRNHEAWEMVRERYLFPPQETPSKDEGNQASRLLTEMTEDWSHLQQQLAATQSEK